MENGVNIHLDHFQHVAMRLADDTTALMTWGLVLARIEDDTGRVLLTEFEVARICECSPEAALGALKRLAAAGAVYSLPSEEDGFPATSLGSASADRYYVNPHVAFKGTRQAHRQALSRVVAPGVVRH